MNGCPCLYTKPCSSQCTCANPFMSAGCVRCCTYGSDKQRRKHAKWLAKVIDEALEKEPVSVYN